MLRAFEHLERHEGFRVTFLPVDGEGRIDPERLRAAITPETTLASIMTANNETGVMQEMAAISAICRERGVLLHTDAVQSFGKERLDTGLYDAVSLAAHKFYGPVGAGVLWLRSGVAIQSIQHGGSHENERRPGTENVAAIAGMAVAAELALAAMEAERPRAGGDAGAALERGARGVAGGGAQWAARDATGQYAERQFSRAGRGRAADEPGYRGRFALRAGRRAWSARSCRRMC